MDPLSSHDSIIDDVLVAAVPVLLDCPTQMRDAVRSVLMGEYEAGWDGERLAVIDIGAHVGSFAIWASMRWPGSRIQCFEPHPKTFEMLRKNTERYSSIECVHAAVYPGLPDRAPFWSRYDGDGEAGLAAYMGRTFARLSEERMIEVPVVAPHALQPCDVLKIDVEGAEAEILEDMDLGEVSLILLEYQNVSNRERIKGRLAADFMLQHESRYEWRALLGDREYRRELAGDQTGHMFFVNRRRCKLNSVLRGRASAHVMADLGARTLSLRGLLRALPGAAARALRLRFSALRSKFERAP